jgi:hypothetical protein
MSGGIRGALRAPNQKGLLETHRKRSACGDKHCCLRSSDVDSRVGKGSLVE